MSLKPLSFLSKNLVILGIVLILVNLAVIFFGTIEHSRLIRLVTICVVSAIFYLKRSANNFWILGVLCLFVVRDLFFQFYENSWGYKGYLTFGILAYATLIAERLPKLKDIKITSGFVLITSGLIAANTYTLYSIMEMLSYDFNDALEVVLFYLFGAVMMIMAVVAISYNNKFNSTRSLLYNYLVFVFIFSDVAALMAYYFGLFEFYYVDRAFMITGVLLLVNYGSNYQSAKEEFYQYEMIDKKL